MSRSLPIPGMAARLAQARERRGWTLRAAGRMLGCDHTYVWQLENGRTEPNAAWVGHLARTYLVSTDWLIFGQERGGEVKRD